MPLPEEAELEAKLLHAHELHDTSALAELYAMAAQLSEEAGRTEEVLYRSTQAYVYALESGAVELAAQMKHRLVEHGREE
ncbi:MAG: hypothetical protein GY948_02165 [Alphaproteobacteria bacterium]|nr:hypothetical protein [Alphaproteobacteria bacterium]